jgi:hypothetical protein
MFGVWDFDFEIIEPRITRSLLDLSLNIRSAPSFSIKCPCVVVVRFASVISSSFIFEKLFLISLLSKQQIPFPILNLFLIKNNCNKTQTPLSNWQSNIFTKTCIFCAFFPHFFGSLFLKAMTNETTTEYGDTSSKFHAIVMAMSTTFLVIVKIAMMNFPR